jgi:hypothetical protein
MSTFNSTKFLKAYFPDLILAYGFEQPQPSTAEKWWRRGAVPGAWLPVLLCILELEHGRPVSLLPYIER